MPEAICWWCVMHILVLCKFSAFTSAQSIIVAITPSSNLPIPAVQQSLGSYIFNCSATSTSGPPPNVTWTSYPAGVVVQVGSLTTSGSTTSRPLTLPSPVRLSYAGLYVCTASANGVSTTASYAFNVTVSTTLSPSIMVTNTPPPPNYYQGSLLTLTCTFGINTSPPGLVPASIQWVGPSQEPLVAGGLVSIQMSNSTSSGVNTIYTSNLAISALSRKDGGSYTCTPTIGPVVPSPYVIDYTASKNSPSVNVIGLPLGVTISPTSLRSSSNSSFQINCTATKPASVPLPFVFTWSWGDRYTGSVLTFNSSGVATIGGTTFVMSQPSWVSNSTPNVTSTLTVSQSLPGVYSYWCAVMVYVPADGPVNQTATTNVSIPGPPNQPTNVMAIYISMDTVSIQWTVPFIVYTQETYVVQYGSAPGNLSQSSSPVIGSANLNVIGGQFGANLTGLAPFSLYYYTVVASNTEGTTTTPVMNISFFPPTTPSTTIPAINSTITPSSSSPSSSSPSSSSPSSSSPSSSPSSSSISPSSSSAKYAAFVLVVIPIVVVVVVVIAIILRYKCPPNKNDTEGGVKNLSSLNKDTEAHMKAQVSTKSMKTPGSTDPKAVHYDDDVKVLQMSPRAPPTTTAIPLNELPGRFQEIRKKKAEGFPKMFKNLHNPVGSGNTSGLKEKFNIDAILIDGYKQRNAYIATQGPLQNTVEDFWRMVWESKSRVIVMLCSLDEKAVVPFWPTKAQHHTCGVSCESSREITSNSVVYLLKVTTADQSQEVSLYHYTGWPEDNLCPDNDGDLHTFCSEVQASNGPMTVVGYGMGRISTFITIHAMMEMARKEQKVDFIKFINSSRVGCPDFIRCEEHLRLCYEVLCYEVTESTQV